MKLAGVLPYARSLLQSSVEPGDIVVDATAGNGHDTLFLANLVGETGTVISCDIQAEAIRATKNRIEAAGLESRVSLFNQGHQSLNTISLFNKAPIKAAIFNLGYLPKGDKSITTNGNTTILAIEQLLERIVPKGLIILVIYHGHPEGKVEKDEVMSYLQTIPQEEAHIASYGFINQRNAPPFVVAIEKR
ncbi:SAM-dependent methyltransferase, MraW methylase family [Bacillus sp. JCM 19046]|nr:SAM-dependent methyltransferase, MraW methylase family [Bacillus sp. JCM 19046]